MSSFAESEAASLALLERIRYLKQMLQESTSARRSNVDDIPRQTVYHSPLSDKIQKCGSETYVKPQSRPISPPTRESSTVGENNSKNTKNEEKLIEETWQLLAQVTFVRVIVEKLSWEKAPKFVVEEAKHQRSPREKGQIYLQYQIPALSKTTPRGSSKVIKVVAHDITTKALTFNDRHVSLCRMTPSMVQLWAQSDLEIKFFYQAPSKKTTLYFGKCLVPLCKVLVLPFSFETSIDLKLSQELSHYKGSLKICVELGSRIQSFLERVEPLRNPTTAIVSPLSFLDPTTISNAEVERIPPDVDQSNQFISVEKHLQTNIPLRSNDVRGGGESTVSKVHEEFKRFETAEDSFIPTLNPWLTHDTFSYGQHANASEAHFSSRYRNRFLQPECLEPHRFTTIAASSSPIPSERNFWKLTDEREAIITEEDAVNRHSSSRGIDVVVQTQLESPKTSVMVDKETESNIHSIRTADIGVQTTKSTRNVGVEAAMSPSSHSTKSNETSSDNNQVQQRRCSSTVASRLKARINELHNCNDSTDPFVDVVSRSFLVDKLKTNINELDTLLVHIKKHADTFEAQSTPNRSAATSPWSVNTNEEHVDRK